MNSISDELKKQHLYNFVPVILQALIHIVTRSVFSVCARLRIEGLENIKDIGKSVVFAPNHVSEWDGPLVRTCLPFFSRRWSPMYFVGMREGGYDAKNFGWRSVLYRGTFFKMLGAYPTFPGKNDYATSLAWFIEILRRGRSI